MKANLACLDEYGKTTARAWSGGGPGHHTVYQLNYDLQPGDPTTGLIDVERLGSNGTTKEVHV